MNVVYHGVCVAGTLFFLMYFKFMLISGEYISLYQSQRQALRLQFQQKDTLINKLLNERSDMQVISPSKAILHS